MKHQVLSVVLFLIFTEYQIDGGNVSVDQLKDIEDLSKVNLRDLPDNSLFTRWRPTYHITSPNSWMNDPCGPFFNSVTQTYHLYYQVQPGYVQWGNISWGHLKSKDMTFWEDVTSWKGYDYITFAPGIGNNQSVLGVFTGSTLPVSINGQRVNGTVTAIYTSVKYLPISWSGPYIKGSETQSLAISYDGGINYEHYANNPILESPPQDMDVTGWRDPKFEKWSELDHFLYGFDMQHYYMTISSGIRGVGPRLLLYQALTNDLTNWTYLGPLVSIPGNHTLNEKWSGSLGYNFEVSNAFSLREKTIDGGDNQTVHHFVTLGTEGGNTTLHQSSQWSVWVNGDLIKTNTNNVTMNITSSGVADWGDTYALNSFYDPKGDRRIFYGWIKEAHMSYGQRAFGYNGQITLPREVFVQVYKNIIDISGSFTQPGPWSLTPNENGTFTFKTLGIRPILEMANLRENSTFMNIPLQTLNQSIDFIPINVFSSNFELKADINITSNTSVGFVFRRSSNGLEYTTLIYDPVSEYLILNRTYSSLISEFDHSPIFAKHILLTIRIDERHVQKELLSLHVYLDNSLLEVYANNRTVLATHIYPVLSDSIGLGYFVGRSNDPVTFSNVLIWTNLKNAFPHRPANSSMPLAKDLNNNANANNVFALSTLFFFIYFGSILKCVS